MSADVLANERAVVEQAMRGDRRAFEKIYRAYAPSLYTYVLIPMLGNHDDAQDCLRETFLAAHKHLASFEWKGNSIYPWLKIMAKNKARDLFRAQGRRQRLRGAFHTYLDTFQQPANNPAEEELQREGLRARINTILETLNPRYATVLRLRLLEDRDREYCAKELGVSLGTLDVLLYRACKSFRTACENDQEFAEELAKQAASG